MTTTTTHRSYSLVTVLLAQTSSAGGICTGPLVPHQAQFIQESRRSPGFAQVLVGEARLYVPRAHVFTIDTPRDEILAIAVRDAVTS